MTSRRCEMLCGRGDIRSGNAWVNPATSNRGRTVGYIGGCGGRQIMRGGWAGHYERMVAAGVTFVRPPRTEPYGQVAVFLDVAGNRWDLLGPS